MSKPVIGVSADIQTVMNSRGVAEKRHFLKKALTDAVALGGADPVILPFSRSLKDARNALRALDGLVISGGDFDIAPSFYGERRIKACGVSLPERTKSELWLLEAALGEGKAVLGICGGVQLINVFFGGSLYQDIPTQKPGAVRHSQKEPHHIATHTVEIREGSGLSKITGARKLKVNSTHHQAIRRLGKGLAVTAEAPDGIAEAVEAPGPGRFLLGVQWHPENLVKNRAHRAIFNALATACRIQ